MQIDFTAKINYYLENEGKIEIELKQQQYSIEEHTK